MSIDEPPAIVPASDHSVLVRFGTAPDAAVRERIGRFLQAFAAVSVPAIRNVHPAAASVLVSFDLARWSIEDARAAVERLLEQGAAAAPAPARSIVLPVCYEAPYAPDLDDVAALHRLPVPEVIRRHAAADYEVHFLGFSPGFPYLGGLDAQLATPRLAVPRTHVAAGSVAIGGTYTGIYPVASPGGWRLIGRTPVTLFDGNAWPPARLRYGDRLRFAAVTAAEYARLLAARSTLDAQGHVTEGAA